MKKLVLSILLAISLLNAKSFTNSIGMKFVEISSGFFMMGTATKSTADCPKDDPFTSKNEYMVCVNNRSVSKNETPQHKVYVKSFYMATTEVTQLQWHKVMGNNPAKFKKEKLGYDSRYNPVENISWSDAKEFVKRLNKIEYTNKYRLPTEEEWEYAARAGSIGKWCVGDNESKLSQYAWLNSSSTHPVAKKKPNRWGIYDMHGNVWEWVSSCYTKTYNSECYENYKVLRGGSWFSSNHEFRSAGRYYNSTFFRSNIFGLRLARTK